jgi:adenine-specific DNA-methyltransferase
LIYAKSIESFEIGLLDRTEEMDAAYTNPDNDLRGVWKSTPLHAKSGSRNYTMTFSNGKTWTAPNGRYPRYSESKLLELYNDNRLYFGKDGNGVPNVKTFLTEVKQGKTVGSIWSYQEVGSSHQANEQLADILGKGAFDNPKPLGLIKQAIKVSNAQEGDIIFDFFSGSGTTGQAVLELNAEDGGDLKFVCVQLPILNGDAPNAQEAGFDHIADIAKERIRRVIKKLETEQNGALGFDKKLDLGMRVFKVAPSNFKIWRGDLMENEEELAEQMELFIDSLKDGAKEDNIAWELAIKSLDPMQLDVRMEKIELGGVPVYNFENGRLFIVLHDISQESINAILAAKPRALLVLDSLFGNQADMITNLVLDCERLNIQFQLV